MNVPLLNRRLVLEEAVRTPDGAGGTRLGWAAKGVLWAEIRPGAGRERAGQAVTLSAAAVRIIVRAAQQGSPRRPRPEQRFREGSRLYAIQSVQEMDGRGRYLVCQASEEVRA